MSESIGGEISPESSVDLDQIDWDLIDEQKALFILDQAEKAMGAATANNNALDSKIAHLSTVYITTISIMIGVIPIIDKNRFFISSLIFCFGMLSALATLFFCYRTKEVPIIGTSPTELLKKKYNSFEFDYLLKCQLQTYIQRLKELKEINKRTGQSVNYSIYIVLGTLFISLLYHVLPVLVEAVVELAGFVCCSCG